MMPTSIDSPSRPSDLPTIDHRRWVGLFAPSTRIEVRSVKSEIVLALLLSLCSRIIVAEPQIDSSALESAPPESAGAEEERNPALEGTAPVELIRASFPLAVAERMGQGGRWLPLSVELENRRDEERRIDIVVEVTSEQGLPRLVRERRVLGPGSVTSVESVVPIAAERVASRVRVEVRDGDTVLGEAVWDVPRLEPSRFAPCVLVAGADDTRPELWSPASGETPDALGVESRPVRSLPASTLAYTSFDAVVLRRAAAADLSQGQADALRAYAAIGGLVVVVLDSENLLAALSSEICRASIGSVAETPRPEMEFRIGRLYLGGEGGFEGLSERGRPSPIDLHVLPGGPQAEFAPIAGRNLWLTRSSSVRAGVWLATLENWSGAAIISDPGVTRWSIFSPEARFLRELRAAPVPLDGSIVSRDASDARPIYGEVAVGTGGLGVLLLDDQAIGSPLSDRLREAIWYSILAGRRSPAEAELGGFVDRVDRELIEGTLAERRRDAGFTGIVVFVLTYVIIVGPGAYFVLRRLGRLPALVWIEPVLVIVALGAVVGYGQYSRGSLTRGRVITIVHVLSDTSVAVRESYLTLFPGADQTLRVEAVGFSSIDPIWSSEDEAAPVVATSLRSLGSTRAGVALEDVAVRRWQEAHFRAVAVDAGAPRLRIEFVGAQSPEERRLRISNETGFPLDDGVAMIDGVDVPVTETIPSGGSIEVAIRSTREENGASSGATASASRGSARDASNTDAARREERWIERLRYGGPYWYRGRKLRPSFRARIRSEGDDFRAVPEASRSERTTWIVCYGLENGR
jgi:hypothetical protein